MGGFWVTEEGGPWRSVRDGGLGAQGGGPSGAGERCGVGTRGAGLLGARGDGCLGAWGGGSLGSRGGCGSLQSREGNPQGPREMSVWVPKEGDARGLGQMGIWVPNEGIPWVLGEMGQLSDRGEGALREQGRWGQGLDVQEVGPMGAWGWEGSGCPGRGTHGDQGKYGEAGAWRGDPWGPGVQGGPPWGLGRMGWEAAAQGWGPSGAGRDIEGPAHLLPLLQEDGAM